MNILKRLTNPGGDRPHNAPSSRLLRSIAALAIAPCCSIATAQCQVARLEHNVMPSQVCLGSAVAVSDDAILLGGGCNLGQTAMFDRSGLDWQLSTLSGAGPHGYPFGYRVSVSGDRCAIGSPLAAGSLPGTDCIYERSAPNLWQWVTTITLEDPEPGESFGVAVALDGDRLAVADYSKSCVFVLERGGDGAWTFVVELPTAWGGSTAALDGDVVLAGESYGDPNTSEYRTYVFERDANGDWFESAYIVKPTYGYDFCGFGMAVSGDTIAIGSPGADGAAAQSGAIDLYERQPSGDWQEVTRIFADDGQTGECFGARLALHGDVLIAGSPYPGGSNPRGSVYIFRRTAGVWSQGAKFVGAPGAYLGEAVAVHGNYAVAGAIGENEFHGAAYVYSVGPDTDGDGVPDLCECRADFDGDGAVTVGDLSILLANFGLPGGATRLTGDADGDADVELTDLSILLANFGAACE